MRFRKTLSILLLAFLSLTAMAGSEAEEKQKPRETITCTAIMPAARGRMANVQMTFYINGYTSEEDLLKYREILKSDGEEKLRDAIKDLETGFFAPAGKLRTLANIIRTRPKEKGQLISIVTVRPLEFLEVYYGTRSRDYEFTIVQFDLDENGKGRGTMLVGAKLEFNEKGNLVIEQLGNLPVQLLGVHYKKKEQ